VPISAGAAKPAVLGAHVNQLERIEVSHLVRLFQNQLGLAIVDRPRLEFAQEGLSKEHNVATRGAVGHAAADFVNRATAHLQRAQQKTLALDLAVGRAEGSGPETVRRCKRPFRAQPATKVRESETSLQPVSRMKRTRCVPFTVAST
jgi:hypothetical protein